MAKSLNGINARTVKKAADDLGSYRRLVQLQKQMIELAKQHEEAKRACDALREQIEQAMAEPRRGMRHRLRESAVRLLKRVPGISTRSLGAFKSKPSSHRK